ncbi:MAG: ACP S-malonyltransferase [Planctomycetes bacterium]|nr:ACP S-malonyltransferase [Planctomycetota bacterium]
MGCSAFLFPGQGAQAVGMAVDLVEASAKARAVFDRGREVLGLDILAVCRGGPDEELNSTRVSQPAIFLHSMAALEVLRARRGGERLGVPDLPAAATAGLSLGEYSALVFAGSLGFEDALRLVVRRGEAMQEACDEERGTMASILGKTAGEVEDVINEMRAEGLKVGIANYNSPGQTVISGGADAVDRAVERLKDRGARRVVELRVAGAYHSPLMASATRKMQPLLREVEISEPRIPFFGNFWGRQVSRPEEIREGLLRQIESPVRWEQCMGAMLALGIGRGLEVGPGRVLQGLAKNIDRSFDVIPAGTLEALDKSDVVAL